MAQRSFRGAADPGREDQATNREKRAQTGGDGL
jgi:hypothetical protein